MARDYTSDGKVRGPVMLTEEEADFLHDFIDARLVAPAAESEAESDAQ
jgi:hypothetical protein